MLQNRQSRLLLFKLRNQPSRRTQIQHIVIGQLFAMQLPKRIQESSIQRRFLVRILSIAQRLGPSPHHSGRLLQDRLLFFRLTRQIRPNQMIIMRRMPKHLRRQSPPRLQRCISTSLHLRLYRSIICRLSQHRHRFVILGRTAQHARPPNINILNRLLPGAIRSCHRLLKGIKIHHHQIDRRNMILFRLLSMGF